MRNIEVLYGKLLEKDHACVRLIKQVVDAELGEACRVNDKIDMETEFGIVAVSIIGKFEPAKLTD